MFLSHQDNSIHMSELLSYFNQATIFSSGISLASAQIWTSTTAMLKKNVTEVLASGNEAVILRVYFFKVICNSIS